MPPYETAVNSAPTHDAVAGESTPGESTITLPRATTPVRRGRTPRQLASDAGQGTVEYVGLLLLMATVLAAVVAAAGSLGGKDEIGKKVVTQIGHSIDKAGGAER
jgi:hypothetical protein